MVLGDLFSVLQLRRYPFVKDSSEVVETRDSKSSRSTACFDTSFCRRIERGVLVPVAQLDRAAAF